MISKFETLELAQLCKLQQRTNVQVILIRFRAHGKMRSKNKNKSNFGLHLKSDHP